jgi:hypothetical protein
MMGAEIDQAFGEVSGSSPSSAIPPWPQELPIMRHQRLALLVAISVVPFLGLAAAPGDRDTLTYGDGQADGKKSLGGSGEMIEFTLPADGQKVASVRIHGVWYGLPDPPDEP